MARRGMTDDDIRSAEGVSDFHPGRSFSVFKPLLGLLFPWFAGLGIFGPRLILFTLTGLSAGFAVALISSRLRRRKIDHDYLFFGFAFGLVLPPAIPLWMVFVGAAFGGVFGAVVFGGHRFSIFSPVLIGRCFLQTSWPQPMKLGFTGPFEWYDESIRRGAAASLTLKVDAVSQASPLAADAITSATPLALAEKSGSFGDGFDLWMGFTGGCFGETCAVAIIVGGLAVIALRAADRIVAITSITTFLILEIIWAGVAGRGGDPFAGLAAGGFLFSAFFIAAINGAGPAAKAARAASGCIFALLTFTLRHFSTAPEGAMYALLLTQALMPLVEKIAFPVKTLPPREAPP